MSEQVRVLITGAGGFIGHHLVTYLKRKGYWVRGVDLKPPLYGPSDADEFQVLDLRRFDDCLRATRRIDEVYALAADMGGMGYISAHNAEILENNSLIDLHTIRAGRENGATRFLYTSSACIYPEYLQEDANVTPLKEDDAYPAMPQDAYGWQKLVMERLCMHYREELGVETRVVRFHNIFGPLGTWMGGREKAPAALCRKVAIAKLTHDHEIEIWGDGEQTRSFCYVDDCVEGLYRIMRSRRAERFWAGSRRSRWKRGLRARMRGSRSRCARSRRSSPRRARARSPRDGLLRRRAGQARRQHGRGDRRARLPGRRGRRRRASGQRGQCG